MNILEVPVQAVGSRPRSGSFSSIDSDVYTLDPKAKFLKPQPSLLRTTFISSFTKLGNASVATVSEKARTSTAKLLLNQSSPRGLHRERDIRTAKASSTRKALSSGSPTRRLLSAAFAKMRLTRSAGLTAGSEYAGRLHSSRADPRMPESGTHAPNVGCNPPAQDCGAPVTAVNRSVTGNSPQNHDHDVKVAPTVLRDKCLHDKLPPYCLNANDQTTQCNFIGELWLASSTTSMEQLRNQISSFESSPIYTQQRRVSRSSANLEAVSGSNTQSTDGKYSTEGASEEVADLPCEENFNGAQSYAGSVSSYTTNNIFSPGLASSSVYTGGMSPFHLSQPGTPTISDFGEDALGGGQSSDTNYCDIPETQGPWDTSTSVLSTRAYAGFQEYSLSETDQASVLTVCKDPNDSLESSRFGKSYGQHGGTDLVHSWNDGSEHRMTALEELVDDLGYLGELII